MGRKAPARDVTLARTPAQLAEGFRNIDGEDFTALLGCFEDYKNHCKVGMELAESAWARMLAVGQYLADMQEAEGSMSALSPTNARGRRGRPRKTTPQFPGTVIPFNSRPRLMVGDVVELCRGCLPSNRGKLAVIERFEDTGRVFVRSLSMQFDTVDPDTGEPTGPDMTAALPPENLYRRSRDLAKGVAA